MLGRWTVRDLRPQKLPYASDMTTADPSFISLRLAIGPLRRCSAPDGDFIFLVKPQFEAGRSDVGDRGVVRDPGVWLRVLESVAQHCRDEGLSTLNLMPSPLLGPAGNVEFLLHARAVAQSVPEPSARAAVNEAMDLVASHA